MHRRRRAHSARTACPHRSAATSRHRPHQGKAEIFQRSHGGRTHDDNLTPRVLYDDADEPKSDATPAEPERRELRLGPRRARRSHRVPCRSLPPRAMEDRSLGGSRRGDVHTCLRRRAQPARRDRRRRARVGDRRMPESRFRSAAVSVTSPGNGAISRSRRRLSSCRRDLLWGAAAESSLSWSSSPWWSSSERA